MSLKCDMAGVSVMLAMPTHRDIPPLTVRSLLETQHLLQTRGIPFGFEMQAGSSLAHHARTKAAHRFLQTEFTRLFWVDSDMSWSAQDFVRLLALSTVMDCVCGLYPSKADPPRFYINASASDDIISNEYGCVPIDGAGLGFACVTRRVIQDLSDRAERVRFPDIEGPVPYLFRCDVNNGAARGEDMAFWADAKAAGYQLHFDPTIQLGHIGAKEYRASLAEHLIQES